MARKVSWLDKFGDDGKDIEIYMPVTIRRKTRKQSKTKEEAETTFGPGGEVADEEVHEVSDEIQDLAE